MRFIALISGGKDSLYTIHKLTSQNHILVGLLYMHDISSTIDSFMYQSVGHELIDCYSQCLNTPLYKFKTSSKSINTDLNYHTTQDDEVEDLYTSILSLQQHLHFEGVSSGAILSNYQNNRVENVCSRLKLCSLSPLWQLDQKLLLNEMIEFGIEAMVVKVAVPGLSRELVGKKLEDVKLSMEKIRWANYCGEGGEYETIVCYMPGFTKRIRVIGYDVYMHPDEKEKEWNVWYMRNINYEIV